MRKSEIDLYKKAYELAINQSPDIEQLSDYSEVVEKHLGMFSETLGKAMTPLQVLLTADREKDMLGYKRVDLDENLEMFLRLEDEVNGLTSKVKVFREFIGLHQEGMKKKLENVEVSDELDKR